MRKGVREGVREGGREGGRDVVVMNLIGTEFKNHSNHIHCI